MDGIARGAEDRWVRENGAIADTGRFAHHLSEAFIALHRVDKDPRWLEIVDGTLRFLRAEVRDPAGRYPNRWERPQNDRLEEIEILDMASAARGYLTGALAFREQD